MREMTFLDLLRSVRVILSSHQKRRYVRYQIFFVFAGILQLLGAGSVAPFVGLLSRPELLHTNSLASAVYRWTNMSSDLQAIMTFAFVMIVLLVLSNVVAAIAVWMSFRFSLDVGAEIKNDLLTCYLRRDYVLLAGVNSAELINKIGSGAPRFAFTVLLPLMNIASHGALLLVVLVALAAYQPSVLLVFGTLIGGGYAILFFVVRKRLVKLGDLTWTGSERLHRLLMESLGGLKEVRLSGTEERYLHEHAEITGKIFRAESIIGMLGDTPRFLLESVAFSALLVLAIIMLARGEDSSNVVAALTLYAMAGYRMLPAGQAIFKAASQVRANMQVVNDLLPDIVEGRLTEPSKDQRLQSAKLPTYPAALTLNDVWFTYPSGSEPVLRGVSTEIPFNKLTVIVGLSGSGKSTLSDLMLGLLRPTSGSIRVGGVSLYTFGKDWFRAVGYVPQSIFLLDDSIANNVAFGSSDGVVPDRLNRALRLARLDDLVEALPDKANYRVGERGARLSGGQRQRIGLARALYHDAKYLILDEATSALDGRTESEVLETLLELRKERTVVMIAHRTTTIKAADHIIMLDEGKVVAEGSYGLLAKESLPFKHLMKLGESEASLASLEASGRGTN
jgi:ATP-binding cassette, subfamily B, bacterial PglK